MSANLVCLVFVARYLIFNVLHFKMFKAHCLFAVCYLFLLENAYQGNALPLDKDSEARILKNEYSIDDKGNYRFSFLTSNGLAREESGIIVNEGQPNEHILVIGKYSYYNTEGEIENVEYAGDENGFNILPPGATGTVTSGVPPSVVATLLGK